MVWSEDTAAGSSGDLPPSYSESDVIEMDEAVYNVEPFDLEPPVPQQNAFKEKGKGKGKGKGKAEVKGNVKAQMPVKCPVCDGPHGKRSCPNKTPKNCMKCEGFHAGKCPVIVTQTVVNLDELQPASRKVNKFNCLEIVGLMTFVPVMLGLIIFGLYQVFSKPLEFKLAGQEADVAIIAQFSKMAFISQFSYFSVVSQISVCSVFSMFSVCSFASLFSFFTFYGVFTCTAVYSGFFSFWTIKKER
jgi:hypothetical protein